MQVNWSGDVQTHLFRLTPEGKGSQDDRIVDSVVPIPLPSGPEKGHACHGREVEQARSQFMQSSAVHPRDHPRTTHSVETRKKY